MKNYFFIIIFILMLVYLILYNLIENIPISLHFFKKEEMVLTKKPWWERRSCYKKIVKKSEENEYDKWRREKSKNTTCGYKAWQQGHGQKILSYTIYGNSTMFWVGINHLLFTAKIKYPGWNVRIHVIANKFSKAIFCPLMEMHNNLHVCDVTSLPEPLGNISTSLGKIWRFVPMADSMVDIMLSRDSDSMVSSNLS